LHPAPALAIMRGMKRVLVALALTACMGTNQADPEDADGGATHDASASLPDAAPPMISIPVATVDAPPAPPPAPDAAAPPDAAPPPADSAPAPADTAPRPVIESPDAAPEPPPPPPDAAPEPPDLAPPTAPLCRRVHCDCTFAGKRLVGRVKYVTFPEQPDFKVKVVTSPVVADLRVQKVDFVPQLCGQWHEDPLSPELKVQIVTDGLEDFSILYVSLAPGTF
jgi:hypothetical protein